MREINQIHVHHTYKPDYSDFNGSNHKRIFNGIKYYHKKVNGWRDIAYHNLVFPDGKVMDGRQIELKPASAINHNYGTIAVCMIGNFDHDTLTDIQYTQTLKLIRKYMVEFNIPIERIFFHNEFASKSCPGSGIKKEEFLSGLDLML